MKILIVGTGVLGSLAGASLVESADADLTFLVRAQRQNMLIGRGLQIESRFGRFLKPVVACRPSEIAGHYDVIILATRCNVFQPSLFVLDHVMTDDTLIVPLFDGIHHVHRFWSDNYPNNPVAAAVAEVRAVMDADCVVRQSGPVGQFRLGMISRQQSRIFPRLVAALNGRRFEARHSATMQVDLWSRHIFLAAGFAAIQLGGAPLRDVLRFGGRELFRTLLREGQRIAEAHGVVNVHAAVAPYATALLREGKPVQAPPSPSETGRCRGESIFLLGNLLRQGQDRRVSTSTLHSAWIAAMGGECVPFRLS
jgi:2-dehydropantoate 2-reductase